MTVGRVLEIAACVLMVGPAIWGLWRLAFGRKKLRRVSTQEFCNAIPSESGISYDAAIRYRDEIGRTLGIAPERLHPAYTFDFLTERLGHYFSIGVNDLYADVQQTCSQCGREFKPPETILDAIKMLAEADTRNSGNSARKLRQ